MIIFSRNLGKQDTKLRTFIFQKEYYIYHPLPLMIKIYGQQKIMNLWIISLV